MHGDSKEVRVARERLHAVAPRVQRRRTSLEHTQGEFMSFNLIKTFIAAVAVIFALNANAQTENSEQSVSSTFPEPSAIETKSGYRPHIGITAGVANPEGSYDTAPEFGLDVGFQPYVPFGIGAMVTTSRNSAKNGAHDLERTTVLARGSYNFGGTTPIIKHSWVGVAMGPVFRHDGTDFGIAPMLGFDIPLREGPGKYLSLGADAKYLSVANESSADAFSLNGVVKYWF